MESLNHVLIIEDSRTQARAIEKLIVEEFDKQAHITWRDTLSKSIEFLSDQDVTIILLDLNLPDSESLRTFIDIYNVAQNIPIIVLSSLSDKTLAINAVKMGAQDYLVKGKFDKVALSRAMHYALERKKLEIALKENEYLLREMNQSLIDSNKKLMQTQTNMIQQEKLASIGQLAAGMAHELNNPLGFITNNFLTLKNYIKNIEKYVTYYEKLAENINEDKYPQLTEAIARINEYKKQGKIDFILKDLDDLFKETTTGFNRITSIVQSLRGFSRIDAIHDVESYDLNAAIEDTLNIAENQLKYVTEVKKKFTDIPKIECHSDEINLVLLNIILNAAQAIESQQRRDLGKITIKTFHAEKYVFCSISDDGPGIPENQRHKIFDPFFTTKEVGKGTGLGLNISYDIIVNKHLGDLYVQSEVGKGTTFTIKLPVLFMNKGRD